MVVLRWGITVLRRRAIILIPRLSFISRQLKECDRSLTSPGCRLVILGGNPDLLDPVLGQLSGHSAQHTRTEPLIFRGKVAKRRKKKGAGALGFVFTRSLLRSGGMNRAAHNVCRALWAGANLPVCGTHPLFNPARPGSNVTAVTTRGRNTNCTHTHKEREAAAAPSCGRSVH